jgi:GcrA cell cycle regulator
MPNWQLETSSPDLIPPPAPASANEKLRLLNGNTPLKRRERDQGVIMDSSIRSKTIAPSASTSNIVAHEAHGAHAHGATWTSERVEQLKGCFGAGLTCSQIAAEIGVSRNAVIGKMNRLGLSRPKVVLAREPQPKRAGWRARIGTRNVTRLFNQHRILMELPPEPQGWTAPTSIHDGRGCSLLELSPGKCRWPISEPGDAQFCYCGHAAIEGLPYCVGHARMAYRPGARQRGSARQ